MTYDIMQAVEIIDQDEEQVIKSSILGKEGKS